MRLGEKQTLRIDRVKEFGVYLTDGADRNDGHTADHPP